MGFYGKINNTSTSLVFDKIYPNRVAMEDAVKKGKDDGVFIGRYVLVNYEQPDSDGNIYYEYNETIDRSKWPTGRLFDSTVWQKTYVDGEVKYVMVAELNSIAPSMSIVVDAPTPTPMPPHFDVVESQTTSYKLHVQPSWGFKVKQAESAEKSDFEINTTTVQWDEGANATIQQSLHYDGDIFFNKKAFSPTYHYNNLMNGEENKIEVNFEASGQKYNDAHSAESQNDTYALSINLPALGEAMSTMWDYIYGEGEKIEGKEYNQRFTNIGWNVDGGPRLVGMSGYEKYGADSLAGSINSVHDLMGKIIVEDNDKKPITLDEALVNRIYYRADANGKKKYFMKAETPNFEVPPAEDIKIDNMRDFSNDYYYKVDNNYYLEQEGYQSGNTYYSLSNVEGPITFYGAKWEPNKYYKDYNENGLVGYELEPSSDPDNTIKYYDIKGVTGSTTTKVTNKLAANALSFYPDIYYSEDPNSLYQKIFPTERLTEASPKDAKGKGLFYLSKEDAAGRTGYLPFNASVKYEDVPQVNGKPALKYFENYDIELAGTDTLFITYDFAKATSIEVTTIPFEKDKYYYQTADKKWLKLNSVADIDLNQTYYHIDELGLSVIDLNEPFYEPNTYYYLNGVDYILSVDKDQRPNTDYYKINTIEQLGKDITIYEPNKYFYKDEEGNMVLDTSPTMTEGRQYYVDIYTLYVSSKDSEYYGSKWNPHVTIPEGITLGYKTDGYEWKELVGFSRTLNTVHGLILRINQIINFGNTVTRDTTTVQGCINQLNDIINKFAELHPDYVAIINEMGQIDSTPLVNAKLINYELGEAADYIADTDTLGVALGKLQTQNINITNSLSEKEEDLKQLIVNEATAREDADKAEIKAREDAINAAIAQEVIDRDKAVSDEAAARGEEDGKLQAAIDAEIEARKGAISQEVSDRDTAINAAINTAITQEVKDRNEAIAEESKARVEALSKETAARENADKAEAEARKEGFDNIQKTLDKVGALTLSGYELTNDISHVAYTDSINSAFGKVQSQLDNLYTRNDGINKEVKENYVRKEDYNNNLVAINEEFAAVGQGLTTLNSNINECTVALSSLNKVSESHTAAIQTLEENVNLLVVRNDGINKEVKENYVRKTELNEIIQGLLETIAKLEERITELEGQINI